MGDLEVMAKAEAMGLAVSATDGVLWMVLIPGGDEKVMEIVFFFLAFWFVLVRKRKWAGEGGKKREVGYRSLRVVNAFCFRENERERVFPLLLPLFRLCLLLVYMP